MNQSQNEEAIVKEIQSLGNSFENEEVLRMKISAANIVEQKMNEKLEHLRILRKEEKDKMEAQQRQIDVLEKARYYAACHEHSVGADMKRKRTVMGDFQKLTENNSLADLASELSEFELIKEDFRSQKACAPWLPEKQAILGELRQQEGELTRLQDEITRTDVLISEREHLLAQHKHMPFKMFCVTLGNYLHKTRQMNIAMNNELKIQESLLEKTKRMEQESIQKSLSLGVNQDEDVDVVNVHQEEVVQNASECNVERVITIQSPSADVSKTTQRSKFTPDKIEKLRTTPNRSVTDILQTATNNVQASNENEQNDLLMQFDGVDVFQTGGHDDDAVRPDVLPNNFSFGFNFNSPIHGESTNKDPQNEETFGFNFNF
uniref:Uncharacterized protein n=1 Tax=Meloidogyne hapla TaxID=6305 RepID=A0A1I8B3D8_MELHA